MKSQCNFSVFVERETDGRWIAGVEELRGVLTYGDSREGAVRSAVALALRVVAEDVEQKAKDVTKLSLAFSPSIRHAALPKVLAP